MPGVRSSADAYSAVGGDEEKKETSKVRLLRVAALRNGRA